ncbi:MAG: HAMP domain-containing histidine kinase [Chloroflexaceae bacterium]|nr:HAMP domain-containing histidine kinase [Chloroflexaceae bacterium]
MIAERQSFCLAARHQGQANGAIVVEANRIQGLTTVKQEELQEIAKIVGFALNYLELQQQSRQRQRYQILIQALMRTMQRGLQGHALLNEALAAVVQSLEVDGGAALKIKYKNLRLKTLYSQPEPVEGTLEIVSQQPTGPATTPSPFSLKDCPLFQQAWAKFSQPLILSGPANLQPLAIADSLGRALGLETQTAVLVVPILGSSSDENKQALVLAALVLWQREARCWQAEEIELVQWACTQVGTALLQQQTLQSVQSLVDERTSQLRISLDVQAKLSERMRQQIQELSRLNLAKDEFIANLSDALKHPLTKIKMAIEMLKLAPNSNQRQRYLDILQAECTKEIHLVNDLLTLHSLKATPGEVKREKLEFNALLEPLALSFEQQWLDKGLNLERTYWQQLPLGLTPA